MCELVAVAFDDQPEITTFLDGLEALEAERLVQVMTGVRLHRLLDERLRLERTSGRSAGLDCFWGLFVGLVLWPAWLAARPATAFGLPVEVLARLDEWGVPLDWARDVCHHVGPGNRAVLLLVEWLPDVLVESVRLTRGDLLRASLRPRGEHRLRAAFGGLERPTRAHPQKEPHPG